MNKSRIIHVDVQAICVDKISFQRMIANEAINPKYSNTKNILGKSEINKVCTHYVN